MPASSYNKTEALQKQKAVNQNLQKFIASNIQPTSSENPMTMAEPIVNGVPASLQRLFDLCNLAVSGFESFVLLASLVIRSAETHDAVECLLDLKYMEQTTEMLDYVLEQMPLVLEHVKRSRVYEQCQMIPSCVALIAITERLPLPSGVTSSMAATIKEAVRQNDAISAEFLMKMDENREQLSEGSQNWRTCIDDVRRMLQNHGW
jgi:hypothetical protein